MPRTQTSSIRINPEVWREIKFLAMSRNKTIGTLLEELLMRELRKAKERGWKVNKEKGK